MPKSRALAILLSILLLTGCASWTSSGPAAAPEGLRATAEAAYATDSPQALALYQRLTQRPGAQAEDWFRLGNLYAQEGNLEAAAAAYREALSRDPKIAQARHNLGMTYLQLGVQALLEARRGLPDVDDQAAGSMRWLACIMELFMGYPDPATCREPVEPHKDAGSVDG